MSVLLIAEAANPQWVSVPLVGWQHSQALAEIADVHLVTQIRNAQAIEQAGFRGCSVTAIDSERIAKPLSTLSKRLRGSARNAWTITTTFNALSYYYFEHLVWRQFARRIIAGEFDVVHRLTPLSPAIASTLAARCKACGVPFVVGPLNGGVPWPRGFGAARRREREWLSYLRSVHKLMPAYRSMREHASAIILGSRSAWREISQRHHHKCFYIPENAVDANRFSQQRTRLAARPLRVIYVGRLVPLKGVDMLIDALAPLARQGRSSLTIVGDGADRDALQAAANHHGIDATFVGKVPHDQVQQHLANADVLVLPSIKEFGGGVVLEAMACGLATVVIDHGGPGELVTDDVGIRIPIGTRAQMVDDLRNTLNELANEPHRVDAMGAAAAALAREKWTWRAKARNVQAVYEWVTDSTRPRPVFDCPKNEASRPCAHA